MRAVAVHQRTGKIQFTHFEYGKRRQVAERVDVQDCDWISAHVQSSQLRQRPERICKFDQEGVSVSQPCVHVDLFHN